MVMDIGGGGTVVMELYNIRLVEVQVVQVVQVRLHRITYGMAKLRNVEITIFLFY